MTLNIIKEQETQDNWKK